MAGKKKTVGTSPALQKLRTGVESNIIGRAYLFYGEETFLRDYWLNRLKQALIPAGTEAFNYHCMDGKDTTVQTLSDTIEALPMLSERTMTVVTDWDLFKLREEQRTKLITLLEDLPDYGCLVFFYDTVAYQPNRTMKKLYKAITNHVETVEFRPMDNYQLTIWISKQFQEKGKTIDRHTAEYLIYYCGSLMTGLEQEIAKIASYATNTAITQQDIDAVANPVLDAVIFDMTNAVTDGSYDRAARIMDQLLKQQEEPYALVGAIGRELRKLYTARLALDTGKDKAWLMQTMKLSDYPAKLAMQAARRTTAAWCANGVRLCQDLDRRMKSERGIDNEGELKMLLARLGAER